MHYYQHHIGDFIRDTSRLSDEQCMAYLRLIWMYYEAEESLPNDVDLLAFKTGSSVETINLLLQCYFNANAQRWHHKRIDSELKKYRDKSIKASKSAKARWSNADGMRTHSECNADGMLNQEPRTKNQLKENSMSGKPDDARMILDYLNEKSGKRFKPVQSNITLINARLKERHSVDEIKAVIDRKVLQWPEGDKMHEYLRPATLFGATNFNQYVGEIGKPLPTGDSNGSHQQDTRSRAQRVSDKLDEIARQDIEQNGFTELLG